LPAKKFGLIFFIIIIFLTSAYVYYFNDVPYSISIVKDNESVLNLNLPFEYYVQGENESILKISGNNPLIVKGNQVGQTILNIRLFNLIPLRSIKVNVLPDIKVYPGGQAIGVLLRSKGVMVVGKSFVQGKDGKKYFPAIDAGIEVGDIIIKINNKDINDKLLLAEKIQKEISKNSNIFLKVRKKNNEIKNVEVEPVRNKDGIYMIGLYVDDSIAGVGTLSFYEPVSKIFGSLGHVITENNSQIKVDVREGKIVEANISGINTGRKGIPGEKYGTFFQAKNILGEIEKNNDFGIYGKIYKNPINPYFDKPIPVATSISVVTGPAKMYTVVQGGQIEEFDINIDKVFHQSTPHSKSMVISITDSVLNKITGGIIQGMSGSPIVQNGNFVGVITHVFINSPSRGYGVFAEWMLLQTDIYKKARIAR